MSATAGDARVRVLARPLLGTRCRRVCGRSSARKNRGTPPPQLAASSDLPACWRTSIMRPASRKAPFCDGHHGGASPRPRRFQYRRCSPAFPEHRLAVARPDNPPIRAGILPMTFGSQQQQRALQRQLASSREYNFSCLQGRRPACLCLLSGLSGHRNLGARSPLLTQSGHPPPRRHFLWVRMHCYDARIGWKDRT